YDITSSSLPLHSFFSASFCAHSYLHSFPTRRSSDLPDSMKPALAEDPASSSLLGFLSDQARNHQFYLCGGSVLLKSPSGRIWNRSEEHTSELQSRENLVCRLLLEKKKAALETTRKMG